MYNEVKNNFERYIKANFDMKDAKIIHKLNHTYYVVENSKTICESMGLSEEDTQLAMLIALLHDIGRFEQAKTMSTFREDITNFDHATLGVQLLFTENKIREFFSVDSYDNIISKAIGNHSKYILDDSTLDDREKMHCRIIRDADKIDSFRAKIEDDIYTMADIYPSDIEESKISEKVYRDFMNEKTIFSKDRKSGIDMWVSYIAFIFGIEFNCSLKIIRDNDYINKLFDRFCYHNDAEKMEILKHKSLDYISNKLD